MSASQLEVEHSTVPEVPDNPSPTPHSVAHPLGSLRSQVPDTVRMQRKRTIMKLQSETKKSANIVRLSLSADE